MAYLAATGSFNIDSSVTDGNDQSITGIGFQPKIVFLWWSGSAATGDAVSGGTVSTGFAVAISSTSRWCLIGISEDAQADSDTLRALYDDTVLRIYDTTSVANGMADFKSMDANGFTITMTQQFTTEYRVCYLCLGGADLTNVYVGSGTTASSGGNYNVTGIGFQPDVVGIAYSARSSINGAGGDILNSIGFATASDEQGHIQGYSNDAQVTMETSGYCYDGEILSAGDTDREAFYEFISDGFTLNHIEGGNTRYYGYWCLKGGQYLVGSLLTRTDGNDIEEITGFEPVAIMFLSANRALSTQDTPTAHCRLSMGAATSTSERTAQAISDENGLADSETAFGHSDSAVYLHVIDDALEAAMDLKSVGSDRFICVMDDVETGACWVPYLAIGATEVAGVPKQAMHYARLRRAA